VPSARTLLVALLAGLAVFVLAAFTVVGIAGELVAALALLGLAARGACALTARLRHVEHC
jgi:hypothetical protein